jgi:tRNA-splicing ligase RtcB
LANRHFIWHQVLNSFKKIIGKEVLVTTIYDISHNIGKVEKHLISNRETKLLVHRKGATRSFGPGRPEIPVCYRNAGQPVLIPGTMGTASYILVGAETSMEKTFGTTCHGAGRRLSRAKAKKMVRGSQLRERLEQQGIIIRCESDAGLAEEAPIAYKDVDNVVNVVDGAGLAKKVARVIPLAVIKG